jgi:hypothetical protein
LGALLLTPTQAAAADLLQVRSMPMKVPSLVKDLPAMAASWADGGIAMPYVVGQPAAVAARINHALFFGQMAMPAPAQFGPGFTPLPEQLPHGTASQEFELARHDDRVLSIKFNVEGCGAYCENYEVSYSFDARNGYALDLRDLLTPAGQAAASRRVVEHRKRLYGEQVKSLKKELAAQRKRGEPAEAIKDTEDRIELNEGCLDYEQAADRAKDILTYARFSLEGGGLVLKTGRCSNHALRALDDVADVETVLTPKELATWLTPYGKTMVLGQGGAPPPASPFGQVLHGKVAGVPVTMMLRRQGDGVSVTGDYVYDKYGRMISVRGTRDANSLELTEGSTQDDEARMTLTLCGTGLSGQWQGKGKTLPVTLDW